jgi:hypothetical protein
MLEFFKMTVHYHLPLHSELQKKISYPPSAKGGKLKHFRLPSLG